MILRYVWHLSDAFTRRLTEKKTPEPFKIDSTDTRREKKLTAGLLKGVLPYTLFNDKFFLRKTCCCMEPPPSMAVLIR